MEANKQTKESLMPMMFERKRVRVFVCLRLVFGHCTCVTRKEVDRKLICFLDLKQKKEKSEGNNK